VDYSMRRGRAGNSVLDEMTQGVRTWDNDPEGETVFVVGAYEHLSDISDRLLRALSGGRAAGQDAVIYSSQRCHRRRKR